MKDQYFIIEENKRGHEVYFGQAVYNSKARAVKAAKAKWDTLGPEFKSRTIMAVYGWLGVNGAYNPNTADVWVDPDVVIMIN